MGTLYLVRHGQASFGAADYDQLSELGTHQCSALGQWMQRQGLQFSGVLRGTLRRHRQSLEAIAGGLPGLPAATEWPGLNEYDSEAVVRAIHPGPLPAARDPEAVRHHFRLLREGLKQWMAGTTQPAGMPSWPDFVAGVTSALEHVSRTHDGNVLLVSSGGPIATAVGHVLGAPADTVVELNMRIRNSAITEFNFTPKRHVLLSFNHLPHLDRPERLGWLTYA